MLQQLLLPLLTLSSAKNQHPQKVILFPVSLSFNQPIIRTMSVRRISMQQQQRTELSHQRSNPK